MKKAGFVALAAAAATLGCAQQQRQAALPASIPPVQGAERTAFALRYIDVAPGSGATVETGKCVFAHYTGWLTDGTKFDSSRDAADDGTPRTPISFPVGARRVIAGWDAGFEGMQVGARRRLFIPYQLAYGEQGRPPVIPPRATLIFDIEVMAVADAGPAGCPSWEQVSGAPAR